MSANDSALSRPRPLGRPAQLGYERSALRMTHGLLHELLCEEESTLQRARRDAARYDGVELGEPFGEIARHAEGTLPHVAALARARGASKRRTSHFLQRLVGKAKDLYRDRFVSAERAYRKTISRIRHGIDLVRLLRGSAEVAGDEELLAFCTEWMKRRGAMVATLVEQIEWFADRPRVSMETGHAIAGARRQLAASSRRAASQWGRPPHTGGYGRLLTGALRSAPVPASNLQ